VISKRGGAIILTFKFETPHDANLMERRFEVFKNRGDLILKGVSRKFETRRRWKLPAHFKIKKRVGRPVKYMGENNWDFLPKAEWKKWM
jgi:hypothetical protein